MKNYIFLLSSIFMLGAISLKAQLNVGSTSPPNPSAILQASSTTKGFLPPSMTSLQRDAIVDPAFGLLIYNLDKQQVEVFSNISGNAVWGNASTNIYSTNGVLSSSRIIDQASNLFQFKNGPVSIDSSLSVDASGSFRGIVTATTGAILRFGPINQSAEGIGSARSIGSANQNGLDFYTNGLSKLSVTSTGNVGVGTQSPTTTLDINGTVRIRNLPLFNSAATALLATDPSGNISQAIIKPIISANSGQNGVNTVVLNASSTNWVYSGYTVTIPALSKYIFNINLVMEQSGAYTQGSSQYIIGTFSLDQSTFNSYSAFSGGALVFGKNATVGATANVVGTNQIMSGTLAVNNINTSPLILYYYVKVASSYGTYTGQIRINDDNTNTENSFYGIPVF